MPDNKAQDLGRVTVLSEYEGKKQLRWIFPPQIREKFPKPNVEDKIAARKLRTLIELHTD